MLTRLRVKGFKNLADVDVSLGPFTCIAGVNAVGKSNLFDAITFLSALADHPIMDAAKRVRDERDRSTDVRSLFFATGNSHVAEMSFEAEMLVPEAGLDDLGQAAKAAITFLKYHLVLGYRDTDETFPTERLEVRHEELVHINLGDAREHLRFPHSKEWRQSVVKGRRVGAFLSTDEENGARIIRLHQDGSGGRPRSLLAANLPRTVLSSTNAIESPTALLARREMQSWRLIQLEPSALRASDPFTAAPHIAADGAHMAATLHQLARMNGKSNGAGQGAVYAKVANKLAGLISDVHSVRVEKDDRRELLTLHVIDRDGRAHAARALSDGTLRFLALSILDMDSSTQGLLCFEEPENGIHPERIPVMLALLADLSVDPMMPVGEDNALRQVIINTHSPSVVATVRDEDLLVAESREVIVADRRWRGVDFMWLAGTWRSEANPEKQPVARGQLRSYLNPFATSGPDEDSFSIQATVQERKKSRRVIDRDDLQMLLPIYDDA